MSNGNGNGNALALKLPELSTDSSKAELMRGYDYVRGKLVRFHNVAVKSKELGSRALDTLVEGTAVGIGGAAHGALRVYMPTVAVPGVGDVPTHLLAATALGSLSFFRYLGTYSHLGMLAAYGMGAGEASRMAEDFLR